MNSRTFIVQHLNDPAVWVWVMAFLVFVVGVIIQKVADQPYFGGKRHRASLEEHYIHGDMTTEEYEDRKRHVVIAPEPAPPGRRPVYR